MSEPGLRKRTNQLSSSSQAPQGHAQKGKESNARKTAGSVKFTSLLALLLIAVGFLAYKNPALLKKTLRLDTSEEWVAIPGASKTALIDFGVDVPKRDAVVKAFQHAWHGYERDAMGDDEYHPISHKGSNLTAAGGVGYTVVDSIDTMLIMGLQDEYERAREWVAKKLSFERDANFNTFETTIRVLGGLLSAYHLSQDELFLEKAVELGDRLLPVFDTPVGLPTSMVNLAKRLGVLDADNRNFISTAEAATLQLEFKYLSMLTDNEIYWEKAEKVMEVIRKGHLNSGLASIFLNPEDGRFVLSAIRLGSRGDSYYEYLLKQYIQTNYSEDVYRIMYDDAMTGVATHLVRKSPESKLTYTSELLPERNSMGGEISWRLSPKQDHLVCFLGGSLMLGATTTGALATNVSIPPKPEQLTPQGKRDWTNGYELVETCMRTHDTATGLSPEIVHFRIPGDGLDPSIAPQDWYIKGAAKGQPAPYDARYILRPETVESLFIAFRLTGDKRYRDYGWSIFQSIEKHCKIESGGYASVLNVDSVPVEHEDKMETFLMSETLKYLYLLFEDANVLPLNKYVFNTEAHPFPIFTPTISTGFS